MKRALKKFCIITRPKAKPKGCVSAPIKVITNFNLHFNYTISETLLDQIVFSSSTLGAHIFLCGENVIHYKKNIQNNFLSPHFFLISFDTMNIVIFIQSALFSPWKSSFRPKKELNSPARSHQVEQPIGPIKPISKRHSGTLSANLSRPGPNITAFIAHFLPFMANFTGAVFVGNPVMPSWLPFVTKSISPTMRPGFTSAVKMQQETLNE